MQKQDRNIRTVLPRAVTKELPWAAWTHLLFTVIAHPEDYQCKRSWKLYGQLGQNEVSRDTNTEAQNCWFILQELQTQKSKAIVSQKSHSFLANLVTCLEKYLNYRCNLMLVALHLFRDTEWEDFLYKQTRKRHKRGMTFWRIRKDSCGSVLL